MFDSLRKNLIRSAAERIGAIGWKFICRVVSQNLMTIIFEYAQCLQKVMKP